MVVKKIKPPARLGMNPIGTAGQAYYPRINYNEHK
jgi:hypothetical protein